MQFPSTIDYRITSVCNMNCSYCFGSQSEVVDDIDSFLAFFKYAKAHGLQNVVLTGGEPTIDNRFIGILDVMSRLGLNISLTTNGICWENEHIVRMIFEKVNAIALPLDSSERTIHDSLRGKGSFDRLLRIMEDDRLSKVTFRITTVVCKENENYVDDILNVIPRKPNIWKLYQLCPCNNMDYYYKNRISELSFDRLIARLKYRYSGENIKIVGSKENERDLAYLFLEPDGKLKTIKDSKEYVIGDIWNFMDYDYIDTNRIKEQFNKGWINR